MYKDRFVIGICTSELDQPFHIRLINRIVKELTNTGNYVLIFGSDSDLSADTASDAGDKAIFDLPNYTIIDVMIIFPLTIRNDETLNHIVEQAKKNHTPVVSINRELEDCYSVIYQTEDSFEKVVRHVIEYHGLREVNFITGFPGNDVSEQRLEIFKNVLADNDILFEEDRIGYGYFWGGPTMEVMETFMHPLRVPPEAIICANDSMAVAVCDFLNKRNIKVPDEILVTGYDGIDEAKLNYPAITTAARDEVNDAKKIVRMVLNIANGEKPPLDLELSYHIQLSQSCGCQQCRLYDQGSLVSSLNSQLASRQADIRRFADMEENALMETDIDKMIEYVGSFLPDGSFLSINEDLLENKPNRKHLHRINPFTSTMKAFVKEQGVLTACDCYLDKVIPELGKDASQDKSVVLMPLHFGENVIGYYGMWLEALQDSFMITLLQLLRGLDNSLCYALTKEP